MANDAYSMVEYRIEGDSDSNRDMDRIKALRLFTRVVDLGSFSRAALELGIGQRGDQAGRPHGAGTRRAPAHRSTHGVSPTDVGIRYYEKCKLIVHHDEEARSVAALTQSQVQGTLRISTSVAFGRRVLAPMVLDFMRDHALLTVDLSFDDRYVNLVEQGVDVAVRMGRLADSRWARPTWATAPGSWSRRRLPGTARRALRPEALADHEALVYSTAQGDAIWHFAGGGAQTLAIPVRERLRSNNLSVLLDAARDGFGIAVLPRYVADEDLRRGAILPLLEDWRLPGQEIHAVYPSPRMVPAKVRELVAWLKGRFRDEWWRADVRGAMSHEQSR